jgi:hypothetical protein
LPWEVCLGNRTFSKQVYCRSSSGFSLYTAIFLSLFFGGLGGDRFYLGHVWSGFLKLLSLGGFGIWSIVDVVFLASGLLTPADGSIFEERMAKYD